MFNFTFFQSEGYKLFIPVFHSKSTDQWEVAGLLFLSTETKENVEEGVKYFKASIQYNVEGQDYYSLQTKTGTIST